MLEKQNNFWMLLAMVSQLYKFVRFSKDYLHCCYPWGKKIMSATDINTDERPRRKKKRKEKKNSYVQVFTKVEKKNILFINVVWRPNFQTKKNGVDQNTSNKFLRLLFRR